MADTGHRVGQLLLLGLDLPLRRQVLERAATTALRQNAGWLTAQRAGLEQFKPLAIPVAT